jgi:hypothetical protein
MPVLAPLPPLPQAAPAQAPPAQAPPAQSADVAPVIATDGPVSAVDYLRAMQARRDVLNEQVQNLEQKREEITEQMREDRNQGLDISGLQARLKEIDLRISAVDQQVALADAEVAKASAVPGATVPDHPEPNFNHNDGPPDGAFVVGTAFVFAVMMPIAIAFARRLWKRTTNAVAALPSDLADRLRAIEHAVESVAVEVERIGEGQRFMSRVFSDRTAADARALGEGAAQPIDVAGRQKVVEGR